MIPLEEGDTPRIDVPTDGWVDVDSLSYTDFLLA